MGNDIKTGRIRVPITELHYIGWAKIKTSWARTDVITPQSPIVRSRMKSESKNKTFQNLKMIKLQIQNKIKNQNKIHPMIHTLWSDSC